MNIQVSAVSQLPIYEQIEQQMREQILNGTLSGGMQLPSIRLLAKELKVGVITSKRAYDDLVDEGLLVARAGKGIFVAELANDDLQRVRKNEMILHLEGLLDYARTLQIGKKELIQLMEELYKEQDL